MAKKTERPVAAREAGQTFKHVAIGSVIMIGAVLWGYAVFHVAMRTL